MERAGIVKSVKTEHVREKKDVPAHEKYVAVVEMQDPDNEYLQHSFHLTMKSVDEMVPGQAVRILVLPVQPMTQAEVEEAARVIPISEGQQ